VILDEGRARKADFGATVRDVLGVPVVEAEGELDLAVVGRFGAALSEAAAAAHHGGRMVVDLTAVSFMDSSGLGALMNGTRAFREGGGEVALAVSGGQVARLLRTSRLDELLGVYPDARSAARAQTEGRDPQGRDR